ncbi:MAG TPA: hypothetical protein PLB87_08480 [Prolixibacteraceae bacterium]|nr:hypothetical protein [Prolixibacteraceae bacterium]
MKKSIKNNQISLLLKGLALTALFSCIVSITNAQIVVDENSAWNKDSIYPVGALKSDFYAQSFFANEPYLTKIGAVIREHNPEGQVILSIVPANSLGYPDLTNVLYQGSLINPNTTYTWYYENMHIRVNVGQKYFLLIDGYDNAGATGKASIGLASKPTDTNESVIYTNNNGSYWESSGYYSNKYLAVYVEGTTTPVPVSIWSIVAAFATLIVTSFFVVRRKLA